jgi:uncharacterized protein (TIGR04255 family)
LETRASYKRNFLTQVIARVDLLSPVDDFAQRLPSVINEVARRNFPIMEPRKTIAAEFQLTGSESSARQSEITEWHYHGTRRDKTLAITPGAVFVVYTQYESYAALRREFTEVLDTIASAVKDLQPSRLGLRYVNSFSFNEGDPFTWSEYFNPRMLEFIDLFPDRHRLARALSIMELNMDDFNVRLQYGLHNPDFPASIRRRNFVVDLDAYGQGLFDARDIPTTFDKYHNVVEEVFESCIADGLRAVMNA